MYFISIDDTINWEVKYGEKTEKSSRRLNNNKLIIYKELR